MGRCWLHLSMPALRFDFITQEKEAAVRNLVCVWVSWMTGLTDGGSHFRMTIILGTIVIWFLVFYVCVPECSGNGSGVRPYLWNQKKLVEFRQSTQNAGLVLLNSCDSFLVPLFSIFSETCAIYSSLILGTDVFSGWTFPGCSSCVSLVTAANFHLLLNVVIRLTRKSYAVMKTELVSIC